jgi:AcrR family transcriptional regulator
VSRVRSDLRAADGRVPGRRGLATRDNLLARTAELLVTTSYRDIKVMDIAREAGTSPATFYQYFPDVETAVVALAEQMTDDAEGLYAIVQDGTWRGRAGYGTALRMVDGFLEFWEEHRSVLRVVELATAEGDSRFQNVRVRWFAHVSEALADVHRQFKAEGRHPAGVDSHATGGVVLSMLASVATHRYEFGFWGIGTVDLRTCMARMIFWTVTGQRPPDT